MTAVLPKAEEKLEKMGRSVENPMPPAILRSAVGFVHWLCAAAMLGESIALRVIPGDSVDATAEAAALSPAEAALPADAQALEAIGKNLAFAYPMAKAVELPTKLSATELSRYGTDEEAAAMLSSVEDFDFRRPDFSTGGSAKLSAAARGTATHTFMQYVDFGKAGSRDGLEAELAGMVSTGWLSEEEAQAIDIGRLESFFQSKLGLMLRSAEKVHREFRFTLLCDAAECLGSDCAGEEVLLQGIIDCLVEEADGLTVIDYKTDRVSADGAPERAQRYLSQIGAYARAAERIFGKPVRRRVLHFLSPGVSVEV